MSRKKSEKLNACADSVDQAPFSAPSKEPGYEATVLEVQILAVEIFNSIKAW